MNPVLLLVGEDADSRAAMRDELRSRFARDYEIETSGSREAAMGLLQSWQARGYPVAMVLADLGPDEVGALEFLATVRTVVPTAARIALQARTGAAPVADIRRAIALGRIDTALVKPVGPRDEDFFGVLTEYLADWAWSTEPVAEAVQIVGDATSPEVRTTVDILRRHGVTSRVHAPDSQAGAAIRALAPRDAELPLVRVLDRPPLSRPGLDTLADEFGFPRDVDARVYDLVIVGAGPAGLGGAVYAASEGLSTLVIEWEAIGGQAGTSSMIRNYLGFPRGISGRQLGMRASAQATRFGAGIHLMRAVTGIAATDEGLRIRLDTGVDVSAGAVLLACGVAYRRLGVAPLEALVGSGVFYGAATGEAHVLEGMEAYVVGGGNSAGQAALHLARYAAHVTLAVRGPDLARTMSDYLIQEIGAHDRVVVRTETEVVDGGGDGHLQWLTLRDRATGRHTEVPAAGLFILIGAEPHTGWLPAAVARDDRGYILTGADLPPGSWPQERAPMAFETSLPRVFAAGDVRAGSTKRVAAAAGEGAVAVPMIHSVLRLPSTARVAG